MGMDVSGAIFEIDSLNSVGAEIEYINQASDGTSWSQTDLVKNSYPMKRYGELRQKDDITRFPLRSITYVKWMNKARYLRDHSRFRK